MYLIYTSQHSDVTHKKQWTATLLDINVFGTVMCYFSVVLYKCVL